MGKKAAKVGPADCVSFEKKTGVRYAKPLPLIESIMAELLRILPKGVRITRGYEIRRKTYCPPRTAHLKSIAAHDGIAFRIDAAGIMQELFIIVDEATSGIIRFVEQMKEIARTACQYLRAHHFKVVAPNFL